MPGACPEGTRRPEGALRHSSQLGESFLKRLSVDPQIPAVADAPKTLGHHLFGLLDACRRERRGLAMPLRRGNHPVERSQEFRMIEPVWDPQRRGKVTL